MISRSWVAASMALGLPATRRDAAFAGVCPLLDDKAGNPSAVTRDYPFDVEDVGGKAALLSIFGGKITTYRKLAEHALEKLAPYLVGAGAARTGSASLPGGDMEAADFARFTAQFGRRHPWLPPALALHYARLYGTRAERIVGGARKLADLGTAFGGQLFQREAQFLVAEEWAATYEDILMRRTKHGLHLSPQQTRNVQAWMAAR